MDFDQIEREMLGDLWVSPELMDTLAYLCDACGGRFAGTDDERQAGEYIMACFRRYGLDNVAAEPFEMRGWERGEAQLILHDDGRAVELPCIALPGTLGCDLEAEIVDAGPGSAADFQRLGAAASGKIILTSSDGPGRGEKYQAAIDAGAAAFIFANAQPGLLASTGSIRKDLPGFGLAYEYAARIRRMLSSRQLPSAAPLRARLATTSQVKTVTARNIIGEIPGSDPAEGWILAGGHYDGHDICQGAQDNAAGTAVLMEAARLLSPLRGQLKTGIRFVLFSGEELGLYGSYAYASQHAADLDSIRLVFNADVVGMAQPLVLRTQASPELAAYLRGLPLQELDAVLNDDPKSFIQNSDHFPFSLAGLSAVWAVTSNPAAGGGWVHTAADTLDKVEPRTVKQAASTAARLLLRMASDPQNLPRGRKSPETLKKDLTDAGFEKSLRESGRWPF